MPLFVKQIAHRTYMTLVIGSALLILGAAACGSDESGAGEGVFEDGGHAFSSPHIDGVVSSQAIAVGARADIVLTDDAEIVEITGVDTEIFEIEDIDGEQFTVRALAAGESELKIMTGENVGSRLTLRAKEVAQTDLELACSSLDMAEIFVDSEMTDEGDDVGGVWLADEVYRAKRAYYGAEDERIWGYDLFPFDVEPDGAFEIGEQTGDEVEIITGSMTVEATVEPFPGGTPMTIPITREEDVTELAVVRLETDDSAEDEHYFRITYPGDEPMLDIVENATYNFMPQRFANQRVLCEVVDEPEFRVSTKTPEVCKVAPGLSDNPAESVELRGSLPLGALYLESTGECSVEIEYLTGPDGYELLDEWTWTVE